MGSPVVKLRKIRPADYRPHSLDCDPARLRDLLEQAAVARFSDVALAQLWMTTCSPKLGFRKPVDVTTAEGKSGLACCVAVLAA